VANAASAIRQQKRTAHQKVEDAKTEHGERNANVTVVVKEVEHTNAQATAHRRQHNIIKSMMMTMILVLVLVKLWTPAG